jgi:predicted phosphohydrolase
LAPLPVVYVAGNHEYYGGSLPRLTEKLREACARTNVRFLENGAAEIGGVRFLGCTLWTDFELFGAERRARAMAAAEEGMVDYRRIRVWPRYRRLRARDTAALHRESVGWLERELAMEPAVLKTVVVTHHLPHGLCLDEAFRADVLSAAYPSDLSRLLESGRAAVRVHGHNHRSGERVIGRTRVVANQRGYPGEATRFRAGRVLEV